MLEPKSATILSIFNSPHRVVVPKYQRNFTWGRNEAQELVEDLKAKMIDPNLNLFLGTVIFDISKNKDGEIFVIDGQQRLTTISILLSACRQAAKKKMPQFADSIQERVSFKDPYSGKYEGQRLVVSPSIKEIYEYISRDNWTGEFSDKIGSKSIKRQVNKVRPLFEYFLGEVNSLKVEDLQQFVKSLYDAYFVRIDIENTSQAFDIFERMNARGVPLDVADLLKNHLFATIDIPEIEEQWIEIIENSGNTPLRMLKYYWVSKSGYIKKSDLYKNIRNYAIKNGSRALVDELQDFSFFYKLVREGELQDLKDYFQDKGLTEITENESYLQKVFDVIEALKLFGITQIYPVLYSAIVAYKKDSSRSAKDLLELLDVFEKYHFINNVICERVGNEVEKLYTNYAKDFNKEKFKPLSISLRDDLKTRLASKEEFTSNFTTLSYAGDSIPLICYIFDRINNSKFNARGGQKVRLFFPDSSIQKKNFNVEHFLPQKLKKDQSVSKDTAEAIDNIGNLLVIARHTNSDLGSLTPKEKVDLLRSKTVYTNNLPYLVEFLSEYGDVASKWSKDQIEKRAREIAKIAFEKIWMIKSI